MKLNTIVELMRLLYQQRFVQYSYGIIIVLPSCSGDPDRAGSRTLSKRNTLRRVEPGDKTIAVVAPYIFLLLLLFLQWNPSSHFLDLPGIVCIC